MNLHECIEWVKDNEKALVLFNTDEDEQLVSALTTFFQSQNVHISSARTASGRPRNVAILSAGSEVLEQIEIPLLEELLTASNVGPGGVGFTDTQYEQILEHVKETTFTSSDKRQLLYAAREIEDRARRVGSGTIFVGFQQFSTMAEQQSVYADLAKRGITVHAFGVPDGPSPSLGPGSVHAVEAEEIAKTWFVVFDGGGNDNQKTALLAEQIGPDEFYGAWTYNPQIVDVVCAHLTSRYLGKDDHRVEHSEDTP